LGVIVGRTLSRVAGIVFAGALVTFAATPAALAQETDTSTPPTTETTTATSETTTTTVPATSETTTAPSTPVTTIGTTGSDPTDVTKTTTPETTPSTSEATEPPKDDYQDNTGHGFVGVGGEGVLVINCAAGAPGNVATQYLDVTGGPDQDESDGRIWNYSVRVANLPPGTTTGKFSWTCAGVEGNGTVDFEQSPPPETSTTTSAPTTSTTVPSSTAPVTTATSTTTSTTTTTAPGNAAPKAQVKVAPKGGVETGFGGTAR
jgi:cytoskeletal protein RodZ